MFAPLEYEDNNNKMCCFLTNEYWLCCYQRQVMHQNLSCHHMTEYHIKGKNIVDNDIHWEGCKTWFRHRKKKKMEYDISHFKTVMPLVFAICHQYCLSIVDTIYVILDCVYYQYFVVASM